MHIFETDKKLFRNLEQTRVIPAFRAIKKPWLFGKLTPNPIKFDTKVMPAALTFKKNALDIVYIGKRGGGNFAFEYRPYARTG